MSMINSIKLTHKEHFKYNTVYLCCYLRRTVNKYTYYVLKYQNIRCRTTLLLLLMTYLGLSCSCNAAAFLVFPILQNLKFDLPPRFAIIFYLHDISIFVLFPKHILLFFKRDGFSRAI